MTRDELSPEWREKYEALVDEWMAELHAIPEPERKGLFFFMGEMEHDKPRRELEKKYFPKMDALFAEAEKAMKASSEEEK